MEGFTLIELSIVLVIVGLIVGGILVGQDLIRAAAVRSQISQIEKYQQAVNTFRGKYGYLPGDIPDPDASRFGFQQRGTVAGQGDGNGVIEDSANGAAGDNWGLNVFQGEQAMFWVDLSQQKLIDGSFNTATPSTIPSTQITSTAIDNYLPQTKISGGHVYVWSGGWQGLAAFGSGNGASGDGNNYFAISNVTGGNPGQIDSEVTFLTVAQAYAIDKKMDDGLPQSGSVMAIAAFVSNTSPNNINSGWASHRQQGVSPPIEVWSGDLDPNTGGPVVAGDGEATPGDTTTCYDNNGVAGATETYSLKSASNYANCWLSFKFQ
jgi:prepilin-type N-terminal cleavage/methylation domain-containing protein